jgi:desulfoferrodoxin (superoxide reductase-like protein)
VSCPTSPEHHIGWHCVRLPRDHVSCPDLSPSREPFLTLWEPSLWLTQELWNKAASKMCTVGAEDISLSLLKIFCVP